MTISVLCHHSKAERNLALEKGRLCKKCFQIFNTQFELKFHRGHSCWFAPYCKWQCPKADSHCTCPAYECYDCNQEAFVTPFERDHHTKYYCKNRKRGSPLMAEIDLEKKKFNCYKCATRYSTKKELDKCQCDGEDLYDYACEVSPKPLCPFNPSYTCTLCHRTFENGNCYHFHTCFSSFVEYRWS